MPQSPDRRRFMGTMSLAGLGGLAAGPASGHPAADRTGPGQQGGPSRPASGVTRALARYVVGARLRRPARAGPEGSAADAAQLDGLRGRRIAARDARRGDRRAGALLGPAAGLGARPPRADGRAARGADERHQLARLRLRRHASQDRHPSGRPGGVGAAGAGGAPPAVGHRVPQRDGARHRGRMPHRQRGLSRPLRPRLAHHRHRRRVRRGGGLRQGARAHRAADGLGAGAGGHPAGRPARDVRIDDQELPSRPRRAERPDRGAPGLAQLHQHRGRPRRQERLGQRPQHDPRLQRDHRQPRQELRDRAEHLQAVRLRHRHPSDHRRLHPAAQPAQAAGRRHRAHRPRACIRWCWS